MYAKGCYYLAVMELGNALRAMLQSCTIDSALTRMVYVREGY